MSTACASGDLREQLKCPLGRAEIRHPQSDISGHDADQCHVRNVVSFGDHLSAYQNVEVPFAEVVQNILELALACHRVAIEPGNFRFRELRMQLVFDALGTCAHEVDMLALALRTYV